MTESANNIQQICQRVPLSSIVMPYVRLHRRGNSLVGLCPFHDEKTPSFVVNDQKGLFHCFGCGASGNVFSFVMQYENLDFKGALNKLANLAGITLTSVSLYQGLKSTLLQAQKWFTEQLCNNPSALLYLQKRNISSTSITKFQLGYAPRVLPENFLQNENSTIAGLRNKQGKACFTNRIIFPIHDLYGEVIGFGGRTLQDIHPKYLNSPESPLFKKNHLLYGLHFARNFAHKQLIVVEGYFDVLALAQEGIKNTVATMGTAMSLEHFQTIWNITQEVVICFDGDAAGRKAMMQIAKMLLSTLKPEHVVNFIYLPQGADPYTMVTENKLSTFKQLTKNSYSLSEVLWLSSTTDVVHTPTQLALLEKKLLEYANTLTDKSLRYYYRSFFIKKLRYNKTTYIPNLKNKFWEDFNYEYILIRLIIDYPQILQDRAREEEFAEMIFKVQDLALLKDTLFVLHSNNKAIVKTELIQDNAILFEKIYSISAQYSVDDFTGVCILWQRIIHLYTLNTLQEEYHTQMRIAMQGDSSAYDKAMVILADMQKIRHNLNENEDT